MHIEVRCFASAREAVGASQLDVELASPATIADLATHLTALYPQLAQELPSLRFAVGTTFCAPETPLDDGATVALIPPVGGG